MKQLSKIMLAAVASVALAAPAFAWDFSASGSATAYFNQTSSKANSGATTKESTASNGFTSAGGNLKLQSSHTDGPNTTTFTYVLDNDGNLDENLTVSGSRKVGDWTASGSVSYTPNRLGCYATDNGSATGAVAATQCPDPQANTEDSTSVTLTNGTMTIVMGDATHLSGQNVSSGSTAGGQDGMDAQGADTSVGAMVDDFEGISLGYSISDTMSVTVAYQQEKNGLVMGSGEQLDGAAATGHTTSGFGLAFSGSFADMITIGFTQASGSTADATNTTAQGLLSTSWSTMGLGIAIDLGDIDPFISYGSATGSAGASTTAEHTHSGNEVGLTYALGDDTITLLVGSMEDKYSTTDKALTTSIMEVGYATTVGPASISVGYGTSAKADADGPTDGECGSVTTGSCDGYSLTDLEVAMSVSF